MKILRNSFFSQAIIAISQILIVILTSHKLEIYELGLYAIAQIINSIACFAIPSGLSRSIQVKSNGRQYQFLDLWAIFSLIPFLVLGLLFALTLAIFWQEFFNNSIPLSFILQLYLISSFNVINQYLISFLRVYKSLQIAALGETSLALMQLCGVTIFIFVHPTVASFLWANILSHCIFSLIISSYILVNYGSYEFPKKEDLINRVRKIVKFAFQLNGLSVVSYFIGQIPLVFFGTQKNFAYAAEYGRAVLIATVTLTILFTAFSRNYYLDVAKLRENELTKFVFKLVLPSIFIVNLVFFFLAVNSQLIVKLLLGQRWQFASDILTISVLGASFQFANSIYLMTLEVKSRFRAILLNLIVMGTVSLTVMYLGELNVNLFNYTYLLTAIASSIFCIIHWILFGHSFKLITHTLQFFSTILQYAILSLTVAVRNDSIFINTFLIVLMFAMVYQMREELKYLLREVKRGSGYIFE